MAKYAHPDVLDGGLSAIKNNAIRLLVLKAYAVNDNYATVTGNAIATITVASADFTLADAASLGRKVTCLSKTGTASAGSGATPDLHFAFTDNASRVLWVTDETTDQVITNGNSIVVPALTYTNNQPIP